MCLGWQQTTIDCHDVLRSAMSTIGRLSVQRDCVIPDSVCQAHPLEVTEMEKLGLIYKQSSTHGHYSLSSLATVSVTTLAKPVSIQNDPLTAYEGRLALLKLGWTTMEYAYDCNVEGYRMMKHQCSAYYNLLRNQREIIIDLTKERCFSHSQKPGYYSVLEAICSSNLQEFVTQLDSYLEIYTTYYSLFSKPTPL